MTIEQFELLMKRVNIEEDKAIKEQMLTALNQYLVLLGEKAPTVAPVAEMNMVQAAPEAVVEDVVVGAPEEKVEEPVAKLPDFVEVVHVAGPPTAPVKEETVEPEPEVDPEQEAEDFTREEEAKLEEVKEEEAKSVDTTTYTEEFGLISTTEEKIHMDALIANGGVLYQEKRSFKLMLFLKDELIAVAKTISLDQFPSDIQLHMKQGHFVSCDVVSFGEITKRSRSRYTDVVFANLQRLDKEDQLALNVKSLLETGKLPAHIKPVEPVVATPVAAQPVKEVAEETSAKVEEVETVEEPKLFIVHPNFADTFKNQKAAVLQQTYGLSSENGVARLFTNGANGAVIIAVSENTVLAAGNYKTKIVDYTTSEKDNMLNVDFLFDLETVSIPKAEETKEEVKEEVKEEAKAEAPEKVNVAVISDRSLPADFPLTDHVKLALHTIAEGMFSLEAAKGLIGQTVNLGILSTDSKVILAYDVFEMAFGKNNLSASPIEDSKWAARVKDVRLDKDVELRSSVLTLFFDELKEVTNFPDESELDARPITEFVEINDDTFAARQQVMAERQLAAQTPQPEAKQEVAEPVAAKPVEPIEETVETPQEPVQSPDELLNKEYNPEEARGLINPTAGADVAQGYQDLVGSQSKDMGGAIQEIRTQTELTQADRTQITGAISGVIDQTLQDTNMKAHVQQKSSVAVVGNLQDGAGNLTETETTIQFLTGYTQASWEKSVGREITLHSQLQANQGPMVGKLVTVFGKDNQIVAQGQVPLTDALLMDGNQHAATLIAVEGSIPQQAGQLVSLRFGNFKKLA